MYKIIDKKNLASGIVMMKVKAPLLPIKLCLGNLLC